MTCRRRAGRLKLVLAGVFLAAALEGCGGGHGGEHGTAEPQQGEPGGPGPGATGALSGLPAENDLPSEVRPARTLDDATLSLATAARRTFPTALQLPVEVTREAEARVPIRAPVAGRVVHLGVGAGDRVRRRALLVMLESDAVAAARAAYRAAQEQAARARRAGKEVETSEAALRAARQRLVEYRVAPDQRSEQEPGHPGHVPLRSPAGGVVQRTLVSVGQDVGAADVLLELTDTALLSIRAQLPEQALGALREGQRVDVQVGHASVAGELVAEVTAIDRRAGPAGATLRAVVIGRASAWTAGARATLLVPGAGEAEGVLAVPLSAVARIHGRPVAFVPAPNGAFQVRPLRLGDRDRGFVQVLAGVEHGEQVVGGTATALLAAELASTARPTQRSQGDV